MRTSLLLIVALSVVIWLLFYGYAPLRPEETVVLVLACTLLVLGGRWLFLRLRRLGRRRRESP